MDAVLLDSVEVDHCRRCGGTFLDPGEGEQVLGPALAPKYWWDPAVLRNVRLGRGRCPKDGEPFKELDVAFDGDEVCVDVCGQCSGIWLERGECRKLRNIVLRAGQHSESKWTRAPGVASYVFQLLSGLPLEVWNPAGRFPAVTLLLLLTCFGAFFYPMLAIPSVGTSVLERWFDLFAMVPDDIRHGRKLWTLFTCIFLHGGVLHLLGNAYFLYTLGDNTEAALGSRRFAWLFLISGLAGSIAHVVFPGNPAVPTVGASGAIAGVLGAYVVLFPRVKLYQILLFVRLRIPVLWYGVFWVAFNLLMALSAQPHVAWMAHLGGFAAGALLTYPYSNRTLSERLASSAPPGRSF